MVDFWRTLAEELERNGRACLVSLLASGGSTPRQAGAMMAVFPGGSVGSIGGGSVEFTAQRLAAALLETGEDALRDYRFTPGDAASLGMVCGGDVTVHFQSLTRRDGPVLRTLLEKLAAGEALWLVRRLEEEQVTAMGLGGPQGFSFLPEPPPAALLGNRVCLTGGNPRWAVFPVGEAGMVHIFGGGHVSRALAAALAPLGFRCGVYDDRREFAEPARFPTAERVALCNFAALELEITPADYVVVMTRGHEADFEVLAQTLRAGARYVGCIGSRTKLAAGRQRLLEAGFTEAEYARLHAPIGLDIGAQTPEEIAVSVAAELIAVRAGRDGQSACQREKSCVQ